MLKRGDRYVVDSAIPAIALTQWFAPFTGGHRVSIPPGTILIVESDHSPGVPAVNCLPERYDELHAVFIPAKDRNAERYAGYGLVVDAAKLERHASLI